MAKFYVGQRVKLARPFYQKNLNITGVIRSLHEPFTLTRGGKCDCFVNWDNGSKDGPGFAEAGEPWTGTHTSQLEPIQPEGWKKISWEEMKDLWTPKEISHV